MMKLEPTDICRGSTPIGGAVGTDRLRAILQDLLTEFIDTCDCQFLGEKKTYRCNPCKVKERFGVLFKDEEVKP